MHVLRVDEELVATAKAVGIAEREMAVSAEQLFASLEDGPSYSKWVPAIREVTWTSPRPFGKGTTRTLKLVGGATIDEVFWAWEPNRRIGFSISAASIRWLSALSELYEITALSSHRCKLRWTLAVRLPRVLAKVEPAIGHGLPIAQNRMLKTLERVASEHSSRA
jgi:Polyketide cyclase / dehydrase and lipid transport